MAFNASMKYRAFLSYSHADQKWARWLHRALESYRLPGHLTASDGRALPKKLSPIFRDRDELPSAASLSDAVDQALGQSEALIVICSPSAAASRWVNEEIRTFRELGRADRIFCFLVAGEPGAGDDGACFPEALIAPGTAAGVPLEPVAADARRGGDGRKVAMLKIVAGMLGVGFDELRQRESRRRQQRLVAMTAGSLLVSTLTILLAVNAVIARNEAQERRAQADNLIDFMLGDLQEQLRKIGRLDVFQSVGDKALEYFATQSINNDTESTLSQRARNLRQIGEVRMEQGDLAAALEAFNQALHFSEQLALRAPDNVDAQLGMANSLFYVGYVHWQHGQLREARGIFESIITIVDEVSARESENPKWLVERAYANTNLGRIMELEGAFEDALSTYSTVMQVNESLVKLEPENPEWQLELGFAHNNLGKLLVTLGRLDEAETHYRKDLEIKSRFHAGNLNHNVYRSYLAVSQYYLGKLLADRGAYPESETRLTAAREHFMFLNEVDPERKRWRVRRANIERALGMLYQQAGTAPESVFFLERSIAELDTLLQSDQENTGWRRDLVRSLLTLEDFRSRSNEKPGGGERLRSIRRHIDVLLQQEPTSLETHELSVYADICAARLAGSAVAVTELHTALETLDRYFPESANPRILEFRTVALAGMERMEEARALRDRLRLIGYQGLGL
jgi:tetratricopeptide (TPR) repeat protein